MSILDDFSVPAAMPMPGSPASNASSGSADSPSGPRTPETPISVLHPVLPIPAEGIAPISAAGAIGPGGKRKSSRRANTAERRATHNAVERQRRETLNGRFLDLAGLLPNLSQIRRPSKSAIVNSSIAHIHASRRHRALAAREVRLLKLEADAIRREVNQWRERAGLPGVEEPARSDAFNLVLAGEMEVEPEIPDYDGGMDEDGYDEEDDLMPASQPAPVQQHPLATMVSPVAEAPNPFAALHRAPNAQKPRVQAPMVYDSSGAQYSGFDSRLLPHGHPAHFAPPPPHYVTTPGPAVEEPVWPHNGYAHLGMPKASGAAAYHQERAHALAMMRQQHEHQMLVRAGHAYGSPADGDDGSSGAGSAPGSSHGMPMGRVRAASNALPSTLDFGGDYGVAGVPVPQGRARGLSVSTGTNGLVGSWDGVGSPLGMSPLAAAMGMKSAPIAIPNAGQASVNMGAGAAMAMMF
jgi:hypothetical protein